MDVREAAQTAREYLLALFVGEQITNVGLEEVEFDDRSNDWMITIGFSRPWDQKNSLTAMIGEGRPDRSYKIIRLSDKNGRVKSLKDRILPASD